MILVKRIDDLLGKGLFATEFIAKGELILAEEPDISVWEGQSPGLSKRFCSYCFKAWANVDYLLSHYIKSRDLELTEYFNLAPCGSLYGYECKHGNHYCSKECMSRMKKNFCLGQIDCACFWRTVVSSSLNGICDSSLHDVAEIVLAASLVVNMACRVEELIGQSEVTSAKVEVESVLKKFALWYFSDADSSPNECTESWHGIAKLWNVLEFHLRAGLGEPLGALFFEVVNIELFERIVVMVQKNCLEIFVESPLVAYLKWLQLERRQRPLTERQRFEYDVMTVCKDNIYSQNARGIGLYKFHSRINHSCAPNAVLRNSATDSRSVQRDSDRPSSKIYIFAEKDIRQGDEITLSYGFVDRTISTDERKNRILQDYGFDCQCKLCKQSV